MPAWLHLTKNYPRLSPQMSKTSKIVATGYYIPKKIISNNDLVTSGLNTTHEWIRERTGILERRICDTEKTSDMAYFSAQNALKNSNLEPEDIDLLIVATSTADFDGFPSVACQIQQKLGLRPIPAFDISAACSGFNYALTIASQFIQTNSAKYALVIGADALSKIVDWTDRSTAILFGDAAGAIILGPSETNGIIYSKLYSDGKEANILYVENKTIKMEGKAVFKTAINAIIPAIEAALKETQIKKEDITYFIPHQANTRIIEKISKHFNFSDTSVLLNIQTMGNTSAASIPTVLAQHNEKDPFRKGDILLLVGFGAGFTWGVTIIIWE